ncbi:toxin glutamine deamidase domain-containing protein [Bifidobacterium scardovii]|uniref:Gp4 phagic protein n=1 Tax=Bifidobacterium scardovii TaxID=158787 RepID=A0A087DGN9_9BIFI|nr:toxin glutamine deamidase domain-containing protein [Bifidobacterium scardovii]DAE55479.1 MAG TPA: minor capsid protein [Caudoviricetes sp.]KFI94689.1 gp4 phagic protein [Bifidobacterium scardovii]MDK6349827.1 toxin glutamine deamidase domain-containing protein [Bifidobacterium scardovii]MDU8982531.1 toxin glutamine deamidase domain-containing protein [Bifidobacterium scardovii]BAQ32083.1 hypothetical phage protein [Bifidobacterium scardovii JCM 12489 = DSM 13734]
MAQTSNGALLTDKHRRAQVRLAITADSQARRIWDATLDPNNLRASQPIWKNAVLQLLQTWWRISAQTANEYLPRFREAETGDGGFQTAMPRFDRASMAQRIDWTGATNVLWHLARGETQEAAWAAARSLFLGVFHEAVLTGGRTTIEHWAQQDSRAIGWRRVSDGDPCAFCAMLVTRGPVYTSKDKAGLSAKTGKKYHAHCGCTVEVVYGDWKPTEREQRWIDDYYRAAESLPKGTPRTQETVLPLMRRDADFRDSVARRNTASAKASRRAAVAARKAKEFQERKQALNATIDNPGKPMSISKADQSHANPKFDGHGWRYRNNCQSCVPAYEMRRRGVNVQARGFGSDESKQVMNDNTLAWTNPRTGRKPTRHNVGHDTFDRVQARIGKRIRPGERYAMSFSWQDQDVGHIVVLERPWTNHGKTIIVVDPQAGTRQTLKQYLYRYQVDPRSVGVYRIDNLELNRDIAPGLMEVAKQ